MLELNASDDRGINVVRGAIKSFAQKKVSLPPGRHKIVILDEADNMTAGAQQTLRRTMERYSSTTRFALACNASSKIIEAIQSRCAVLRFTRLSDAQILARLEEVVKAEGVDATESGLEAIIFTADGDMRQALNNLQATVAGFQRVTAENVFKVCDQPHPVHARTVLLAAQRGDLATSHKAIKVLWDEGYAPVDILSTLFRVTKGLPELSDEQKLAFIREIGVTHMRCVNGLTTLVQLSGLVAKLTEVK